MHATAQPISRLRGWTLSATAFARIAWVNVGMLVLIIATGATVRLTGSGLGCEKWPGCTSHHFEPKSYHSYVEYSNRIVAFITILVTLATFGAAWWAGMSRGRRRLALVVFVGTLLQAPLGALTIHFHLNPWFVLSHFLLSALVLGLAVVLAVDVSRRPSVVVPAWVRAGSLVVWVSAVVLLVSGTFATAAGPHPGSTVVRRLWSFQPAVYWHVRATAVFGIAFLVGLVWLVWTRSPHLRAALVVLALLLAQMAIGEIQYRTHLPWWLVLIHVSNAALVWTAVTAFVVRLWRPAPA